MSGPPGLIPDTRRLAVGRYILSYRVRRGVVDVFAVRHGRQRDARAPVE
jgi:plasmid stabilization system protein ParE